MNPSTPALDADSKAAATTSAVSKVIRRVHMFTALFLGPWMLMYALSTVVMTHHKYVATFYPTKNPAFVPERELDYTRSFPTNTAREEIGKQILADVGLEGAHSVSGGNGKPIVVTRQHALISRRVVFDPGTHKVTIQREEFRTPAFLERMHRRRGYKQPYALDDTWGFTVDVAVVSMMFWSLSGIWLWWELKSTRAWGALSFGAGAALFIAFAVLI